MAARVVIKDGGVHIITGPSDMCECGIDQSGRARSCLNIIQDSVGLWLDQFRDGKVPKGNPMSTVRCKAVCTDVKQNLDTSGKVYQEAVSFVAVYSSDPNSENKWFSQWTPMLSLNQTIENPDAFGTFVKGEEYYVDFTHCPKTPPQAVELAEDDVASPSDSGPVATVPVVEVDVESEAVQVPVTTPDSAPAESQAPKPEPSQATTEPMPPQAS